MVFNKFSEIRQHLVNKFGEEKAAKYLVITGCLIVAILVSFPMAMLITLLPLEPVWIGWLIYAWGLFVMWTIYNIHLFLGKSNPLPEPKPLPPKTEKADGIISTFLKNLAKKEDPDDEYDVITEVETEKPTDTAMDRVDEEDGMF
jgi:hypothetical protein